MKTYSVGDIHGRCDLVLKAIDIVEAHSNGDECRLLCTGDMIDRGPESAQVLETFRRGRINNIHMIALQGNHESMMVEVMERQPILPHLLDWWVGNGGGATMKSYGVDLHDIYYDIDGHLLPRPGVTLKMDDDIKWLKCLPTFFTDDPHRIYVHGGMMVISRHDGYLPLAKQKKETCQWLRSDKTTDYGPFEGRHIVHGHEQFQEGPILLKNRTNLDTFAWRTGRLAIGVFDDAIPGGPTEILWAQGSWPIS